jgi:D-ribose pyranase
MLRSGILNPQLNHLLSRVRHTNTLVIADRGFPFWPQIETIDLALVDDLPTVLNILEAIVPNFSIGEAWMASEFTSHNDTALVQRFRALLPKLTFVPHLDLKQRVPAAIGLVRSGGTAQYSNVILQSA